MVELEVEWVWSPSLEGGHELSSSGAGERLVEMGKLFSIVLYSAIVGCRPIPDQVRLLRVDHRVKGGRGLVGFPGCQVETMAVVMGFSSFEGSREYRVVD